MRVTILALAALATSCGVSTARLSGGEDEELASSERLLEAQLEQHFGAGARVQRMFGDRLLGVTTEAAVAESDVTASIGIARWDGATVTPLQTEHHRQLRRRELP